MNFLVDYNLTGHAEILLGSLTRQGWTELLSIRLTTFYDINLPTNSDDLAQANQMILLTANRSMKGENSLEQVLREENTVDSLPVVTISDANRFLVDRLYRNRCIDRILDIITEIEIWKGVGRLYVP
jgi:hypothetical protein